MLGAVRHSCIVVFLFFASGCDCNGRGECLTRDDCLPGWSCIERMCIDPDGGTGSDGGGADAAGFDAGCAGGVVACAGICCVTGERCFLETCVPDLGTCAVNDDCASDSYCAADGTCVPYGVPPERVRNDECVQDIDIDAITPALQCAWTDPPAGDPYPGSNDLQGTPLVADFDLDDDPRTLRPSIVFSTFGGGSDEVLRMIDGQSCEQQHVIATGITSSSTVGIADLTGDGRPEVIANTGLGLTRAWTYDVAAGAFVQLWSAATCVGGVRTEHSGAGSVGFSPSIHDLDDDGSPEVIIGGSIYAANGCLLASLGTQEFDRFPVVADVDEDGAPEIVSSTGVYRYDPSGPSIERETYFAGYTGGGSFRFAAVGDLGVYPLAAFGGEDRAEIVLVGDGQVYVETLEGTRIFTATLPSGRGGPPTIADFDGDGRAEFAAAAHTEYTVFDLDCIAGGDPMGCGGRSRADGILWALVVDERSSGVTGSSVFDFDADGRAEVVYHDECFLRVFSGVDGEVLYSFPRSSLTWFEMPVIADVDGDFHTEIVVGAHEYTGSCPATDPYFPSATFMPTHGVFVLRDELDRWATSRPIWNQHAYSVTHIDERGTVPRTSAVTINHRDPDLNNFRQNTQGDLEALGVADLTTSLRVATPLGCRDGMATVTARVCNRGRLPLGGGLEVALREGAIDGPELCRTVIASPIGTGECVEISCTTIAPETAVDIYVVPDPDGVVDECHEENSWGVLENVTCVLI